MAAFRVWGKLRFGPMATDLIWWLFQCAHLYEKDALRWCFYVQLKVPGREYSCKSIARFSVLTCHWPRHTEPLLNRELWLNRELHDVNNYLRGLNNRGYGIRKDYMKRSWCIKKGAQEKKKSWNVTFSLIGKPDIKVSSYISVFMWH